MALTLMDLLIPYECRKGVLQHLSAWDVAKLDLCLDSVLDERERRIYLNPVRDLFQDITELGIMIKAGMKLVLIGNDVVHLQLRQACPARYARREGPNERLQIFLLGMFPAQVSNPRLVEKMMQFCVGKHADQSRVDYDKASLAEVRTRHPNHMFLMSFGIPVIGGRLEHRGFWYSAETPDKTIDLKVYVPCIQDRLAGEAILRPSELSSIAGYKRFRKLRAPWIFLRVFFQSYALECAICPVEKSTDKALLTRVRSVRTPLVVRFLYTKSVLQI